MNNECLGMLGLGIIVILGVAALAYPLRKRRMAYGLSPMLLIALVAMYWYWGSWSVWQHHLHEVAKMAKVSARMKAIGSPEKLVSQLRAKVLLQPDKPQGWYLLGRLYVSLGQWSLANEAFAKAHDLDEGDVAITINYAQSLWQLNDRQFNSFIRKLLKNALKNNSSQVDALTMLAMDAFLRHDYQKALNYWRRLLPLVPKGTEDEKAVREAITKAQSLIKPK